MRDIIREFHLSKEQLLFEAEQVEQQIENNLSGRASDFPMLPSYLGLPDGKEQGEFLALDFGGTNLRIARLALADREIKQQSVEQKAIGSLLPGKMSGTEELFLCIAQMISAFTPGQGGLLGHTFSYPTEQTGINTGKLQYWTKEIAFSDAAGIDINGLLAKKLVEIGRMDIVPVVLLNDTVAVLLASAYQAGTSAILGSICGTGHNTAYYEPQKGMVINMESGNFRPSCQNRFDKLLDCQSSSPGKQLFEKMVAGNYLARLAALVASEVGIDCPHMQTTHDMTIVLEDKKNSLSLLVAAIIKRAAALVAAEYIGIYNCLQKKDVTIQKIAIDGSIYNKIYLFKQYLQKTLQTLTDIPPRLVSGDNYSLKGAAVACSIAKTQKYKD